MTMIELDRSVDQISSSIVAEAIVPSHSRLVSTTWLTRARFIAGLIYVFVLLAYLIFIIVCIVLYPRCQSSSTIPWWMSSVLLRFSSRTNTFNDMATRLDNYRTNLSVHVVCLGTILSLSNQSNPLDWNSLNDRLGHEQDLTGLIARAHEHNIRVVVDYPLNHLSIQSSSFVNNDDAYFLWNDQGQTSNWMTSNNRQRSAWTYNYRKNSFYLHQFDNNDSIDINYRNNRVLNDVITSFAYWDRQFQFDGFNIQGISYAYEDYQYENETIDGIRTRHLEEDYLLLARIRHEIDRNKIVLLDSIDSSATDDEHVLTRYFDDPTRSYAGVHMASLTNSILVDERTTNVSSLFDRYYKSLFYKRKQVLLWSSQSLNSNLNEAFFAACLFHNGAISIDADRQADGFSRQQWTRLRQLIELTRTLDVFRDGHIEQTLVDNSQWLTIERARRGSKHHMLIVNFSSTDEQQQAHRIELKHGVRHAVEVLLTNIAHPSARYEINALIDMTQSIQLRPYEYLVIRWSSSIDSLNIIF
jgi:hypothetical protein